MKLRLDDRVAIITQRAQERLYGRTIKFGSSKGRVIEYGQIIIPYDLYRKNTDEIKNMGFKITHTYTSPRGESESRETYEFNVHIETSTLMKSITNGINSNHLGQYNRDLALEVSEIVGVESFELEKFSNQYTNLANKLHVSNSHPVILKEDSVINGDVIEKGTKVNLMKDLPGYIEINCNLRSIKK